MEERAWDVFISYGHGDAEWVRVLAANLERARFHVFYDEWEIARGDRFVKRLEEGLRNSTNGVLVVSPHALSRPWVREEYEVMLRAAVADPTRRLTPVLLADAELPPFLANRDWVDFRTATTGPSYDAAFEQLVCALRAGRRWTGLIGTAPGSGRQVLAGPASGRPGRWCFTCGSRAMRWPCVTAPPRSPTDLGECDARHWRPSRSCNATGSGDRGGRGRRWRQPRPDSRADAR